MIEVTYNIGTDPHWNKPFHGWVFKGLDDRSRRRYHKDGRVETQSCEEFITWLIELGPALNVWVEDKKIWDYRNGWIVSPLEFQALIKQP